MGTQRAKQQIQMNILMEKVFKRDAAVIQNAATIKETIRKTKVMEMKLSTTVMTIEVLDTLNISKKQKAM